MIKTPYILVAVTLPVLKSYTYKVPDHLKDRCRIGARVLVPFGRRRVTGYIVKGQDSCDGFKAKQVIELLDEFALFPDSQVSFFTWISDYYLFPLGQVIKAALPAGLDRHDVLHVAAAEKGRRLVGNGELAPAHARVMEAVLELKNGTVKQLAKKVSNVRLSSVLRTMEKNGLVTLTAALKRDGASVKKEKFVRLGKIEPSVLRMSKKRKKILAILKEKEEISMTALKVRVPTAPTLVKPMAQAGVVAVEERSVFRDPLGEPVEPDVPPELTSEQMGVVEQVIERLPKGFCPYLLSGVTGSGKTEVYMRVVRHVVDQGKTAIVLVPEISLISQTERRFRARFGKKIAVIHSALTASELLDQWRRIATGRADIVIGARSAIFAPFDNIGIIIVDEEHDTSYKQESGLRYNARDMAVVRAKQHGCPVILGSATPSVQTYQNVVSERFSELKLKNRINRHPLPEITLVDLKDYKDVKGTDRIITPVLYREIRNCLNKGNQALVFLNRRGFATYPVCGKCSETLSCRHCDITLTFHRDQNRYRCHLCGYDCPVTTRCPECGSDRIRPFGYGTQKVESILKELFPDARLARMDQDTTAKKGATIKILKDIRNRNVDIVVGTQMLAKGHDFPAITLVGVVCADLSLNLPDFRAGERTFQLLAQVAGRAGRGSTPGKVIMQTYNPDHFIIDASRQQDFVEFFQKEVPFRKALMYPPFSRMIQLKISGRDKQKTKRGAKKAADLMNRIISETGKQPAGTVQVLGPVESPIQRISSRFRWQILLKSVSSAAINRLAKQVLEHPDMVSQRDVSLVADVDPYSLM